MKFFGAFYSSQFSRKSHEILRLLSGTYLRYTARECVELNCLFFPLTQCGCGDYVGFCFPFFFLFFLPFLKGG